MTSKVIFVSVNETVRHSRDVDGVGNLRQIDSRTFRYVCNKDSVALNFGEAAYHKISDQSLMLHQVYQCLDANLSVFAGIVTATDGLAAYDSGEATYNYGWVQVYGYNGSVSISGATTGGTNIAAGDYLKGVTAQKYLVRDAAPPTGPSYDRTVQVLEAVATTTTPAAAYKKAFIRAI